MAQVPQRRHGDQRVSKPRAGNYEADEGRAAYTQIGESNATFGGFQTVRSLPGNGTSRLVRLLIRGVCLIVVCFFPEGAG